ncbi:MAG: aminotransferase class I/II-fold pyridoxal phosphate-dependent enzyme [Myxococcales bacterium]|nr:aminotransferase class I/II-fold pyridoxal phosphate-dependent enzyme [Myxococcales bacterium]
MDLLPLRNATRPGDDPIFALNREANQRKASGQAVINATVGALLEDDGALAVLPTVLETLHGVSAAATAGYAPIAGVADFHKAVIADLLGTSPLAAQAVAVSTPGGTGALRHALSTFLDHDQAVLTSSFYWGPYATLAEENARRLVTFPMFDGAMRFDTAGFARAVEALADAQGRVLVFLNDPCHNPTGYSMTPDEWTAVTAALVAVSKRVPTAVLADVAYLAYGRDQRSFLKHLEPLAAHAAVLFAWSGSKAFSLYGARVGALVACTADAAQRTAIERALSFASRGTWSNCNAAAQHAIARCLTDPALRARVDAERERLRALLDARVAAFNAAAKGTALRYPPYDGGFFVTVLVPDAKATAEALKARGVFVVPQAGAVRVALCGVAAHDVAQLVAHLAATV